ncbi:MAG: membrane protein insertion efficiency factor YidD [Helicobacteraceae bacterium]|nr:membrane protein insertion efficiency factor YidD [Helicobacteraceae bacterium]
MQTPLLNRPFWYLVRLYQIVLSPFLGRWCRFYPSCSTYALWELERRSLPAALARIIWRLARCNPLCKGGFDYPAMPRNRRKERRLLMYISEKRGIDRLEWFIVPRGDRYILIKRRKK